MVDFFLAESAEHKQFLGAHFARAICGAQRVVTVGVQFASEKAADGDPAGEAAKIQ